MMELTSTMDLNPRSLAHLYKRIGAGPHHEEIRLAEDVQRRRTDRRVEERRESHGASDAVRRGSAR